MEPPGDTASFSRDELPDKIVQVGRQAEPIAVLLGGNVVTGR
jgi:hypothetical protein